MAAPMVKTATPGVYKRGGRYVVGYRDPNGKQRWETARTLADARKLKDARRADISRGEFFESSRLTVAEYAGEWIGRYQGKSGRFRESTREEYKRSLDRYVLPRLGRRRLAELTPRDLAAFVAWLQDERAQGKALSDSTIRNVFNPLRACLSTAVREGVIRNNPAREVVLPNTEQIDDDEGEVRTFTTEQLDAILRVVQPEHRALFQLLAATGLRISEALGLEWRHLELDGSNPQVKVRQALVRGRIQPPKSRHGRREVRLPQSCVEALRARRRSTEWHRDSDYVFSSQAGTPIIVRNLRRRVLVPTLEEADASWAGFHTFRHTYATMLFARGDNMKQVQKALGHHSPAFTMSVYVHLLKGDEAAALDPLAGVNIVQTQPAETSGNDSAVSDAESLIESAFSVAARTSP